MRAIADPKLVGRMQVTLEVGPKTDAQPGQATLGFKGAGYDFRVDGPYRQLYPIVRALQAWSELALGAFNGNLCIECGEPLYEVTETRLVCAQQHRTAVAAPGSPVVDGYMVCSADDIAWRDDETPEPVEITDLTIRGWK